MEDSSPKKSEETSLEKDQEKLRLNRTWAFWENYDTKTHEEKDYTKLLKEIYSFNDLISFWQFWNKYPGSDTKNIFYNGDCIKYFFKEKYRIIAMNLFVKGIKPEWEDKKNKGGKVLILEYIINEIPNCELIIISKLSGIEKQQNLVNNLNLDLTASYPLPCKTSGDS